MSPRAERRHRRLLLGRLHLAVQQPEPQARQLAGGELLELLGRGLGLDLRRALHERADDVRLAARGDLLAQTVVGDPPVRRRRPDHLGGDRRPPRRHLVQLAAVEVAVDEHRRGTRDRRRRHHEHVRRGAEVAQQRALLDAEAVLLVDDREAELRERRVAVEQRVGADDDVDVAGGEPGRDLPAVGRADAVGEQRHRHRPLGEQRPLARHREVGEHRRRHRVQLLGEHLGRRHRARPGTRPAPPSAAR